MCRRSRHSLNCRGNEKCSGGSENSALRHYLDRRDGGSKNGKRTLLARRRVLLSVDLRTVRHHQSRSDGVRNRGGGERGRRDQGSGCRWRDRISCSARANEREPVRAAESGKICARPRCADQSINGRSNVARKIRKGRTQMRPADLQLVRNRAEDENALRVAYAVRFAEELKRCSVESTLTR